MPVKWKSIAGKTTKGYTVHKGMDKEHTYFSLHENQRDIPELVELRIGNISMNLAITIKREANTWASHFTDLDGNVVEVRQEEKKAFLKNLRSISRAMEEHRYIRVREQFKEHVLPLLRALKP